MKLFHTISNGISLSTFISPFLLFINVTNMANITLSPLHMDMNLWSSIVLHFRLDNSVASTKLVIVAAHQYCSYPQRCSHKDLCSDFLLFFLFSIPTNVSKTTRKVFRWLNNLIWKRATNSNLMSSRVDSTVELSAVACRTNISYNRLGLYN